MRRHAPVAIVFVLAGLAQTGVVHAQEDRWSGPDKQRHFSISVASGAIGTWAARDVFGAREYAPLLGAALGQLPGLAREIYQGREGRFSHRDHLYNIAGALVGAHFGTDLAFSPTVDSTGRTDGIMIRYRVNF